jgi:hypothetical protein
MAMNAEGFVLRTLSNDISGYYRFLRKPTRNGFQVTERRITFSLSRHTQVNKWCNGTAFGRSATPLKEKGERNAYLGLRHA